MAPENLVAHRGYPLRYPENTLCSLQQAVDAGAIWLECDVQLTKDRVPVLCHDPTLDRMSADSRRVFDVEIDELLQLKASYPQRFGQQFRDVEYSRLSHVCQWLAQQDSVQLFVELKQESISQFGLDVIIEQVAAAQSAKDQIINISFNDEVIRRMRDRYEMSIGWVISEWNESSAATARTLQPDFLFVNHHLVSADQPLWQGEWKWAAYTVNDQNLAKQCLSRFDLVETDDIGELLGASS